jgi:hypothetical protein
MSSLRLSAVKNAWLHDESVPLPAVVWSALWAALWLAALTAPDPAVPDPASMTGASVVVRFPILATARQPPAAFDTGATGHSPQSAQPGIQP